MAICCEAMVWRQVNNLGNIEWMGFNPSFGYLNGNSQLIFINVHPIVLAK